MSMRLVNAAEAVRPMRGTPATRHDWAALGLPDTGWMLVTDKVQCEACPSGDAAPCTSGCAASHHLVPEAREAMGACLQCEPAPCEEACAAGAITRNAQGVMEVDQEVCNGCRFCIDACEYDALLWVDPYHTATPPHGYERYSTGRPSGELPNTVAKCTLCTYRLSAGDLPVCVDACPLNAIWVGNLDRNTATNGVKILRLSDLLQGRTYDHDGPRRHAVHLVG